MTQEPITLYKLIILYMLDRAKLPLTRTQIGDFLLEKEYGNYLTLQQAISELQETKMISTKTFHNRTQLMLTEEGRATLKLFDKDFSGAIKQDINQYLKENRIKLRNELSVTGQYQKIASKTYETVLQITECGELLLELRMHLPDEKTAAAVCLQWQNKNKDIYDQIIKELF